MTIYIMKPNDNNLQEKIVVGSLPEGLVGSLGEGGGGCGAVHFLGSTRALGHPVENTVEWQKNGTSCIFLF